MRASSGEYFVGLDHVRALAMLLVFCWHFLYIVTPQGDVLSGTFDFPLLSIFTQGHTGVSMFMVLSGYLFAKLTQNKKLDYRKFLTARFYRLAPLLIIVFILTLLFDLFVYGVDKASVTLHHILMGPIFPTWPNGGWSIAVEFHFYLLFPFLLMLGKRMAWGSALIILGATTLRFGIALSDIEGLEIREIAYKSIIGRIDQFILGILFATFGEKLVGRHGVAVFTLLSLLAGFFAFNTIGGYYGDEQYHKVWIFSLTLEGFAYAILISYYDRTFKFRKTGLSGVIACVGEASYSIYLLHTFFVFEIAYFIHANFIAIDNVYTGLLLSIVCFVPTAMLGWVSYNRIEKFWLRFRRPYSQSTHGRQPASAVNLATPFPKSSI